MTDYLKEERKRGEVVKCAQCHREIWNKWKTNDKQKRGQPFTQDIMTFCGPCYFGKRRKNVRKSQV